MVQCNTSKSLGELKTAMQTFRFILNDHTSRFYNHNQKLVRIVLFVASRLTLGAKRCKLNFVAE